MVTTTMNKVAISVQTAGMVPFVVAPIHGCYVDTAINFTSNSPLLSTQDSTTPTNVPR